MNVRLRRFRLFLWLFLGFQVLLWVLVSPIPVYADDCLSDPLNAADCMRTPGFRQITAVAVSTVATISTVLVNVLGNMVTSRTQPPVSSTTSAAPPVPPSGGSQIYGSGTPDDPYRDAGAFKVGPDGSIERYPEMAGKPLEIWGSGTSADAYRDYPSPQPPAPQPPQPKQPPPAVPAQPPAVPAQPPVVPAQPPAVPAQPPAVPAQPPTVPVQPPVEPKPQKGAPPVGQRPSSPVARSPQQSYVDTPKKLVDDAHKYVGITQKGLDKVKTIVDNIGLKPENKVKIDKVLDPVGGVLKGSGEKIEQVKNVMDLPGKLRDNVQKLKKIREDAVERNKKLPPGLRNRTQDVDTGIQVISDGGGELIKKLPVPGSNYVGEEFKKFGKEGGKAFSKTVDNMTKSQQRARKNIDEDPRLKAELDVFGEKDRTEIERTRERFKKGRENVEPGPKKLGWWERLFGYKRDTRFD